MTAHKSLSEALVAFQAEAPTLPKDATNPHFRSRFTPLDTIVETVRPLLAKHGLAWTAQPGYGPDSSPALHYQLIHGPTGERLEGTMPLLVQKQDPQGQGSGLTYARRYALSAVLNLVSDEDDDGNVASRERSRPQASARPAQPTERPASASQRGLLNARASEAELCPTDFANLILLSSGKEIRSWESEDAAQAWLRKALDRLPARLVDPVLEEIAKLANGAETFA